MDVAKWQMRLEDTFGVPGPVGRRLFPILDAEEVYGKYVVQTFQGYRVLTDSFLDFYIETLELAAERAFHGQLPETHRNYMLIYVMQLTNFRSFRAAEKLSIAGYPLDGYALLRDLKDRSFFFGAIASGISSFGALQGTKGRPSAEAPITRAESKEIRKRRIKEEHKVLNLTLGKKSGLEQSDQDELDIWTNLFHEEVHGSRMTFYSDFGVMVMEKRLPPIGPEPRESDVAMFLNRSSEICWLLLRTLPFLQLEPCAFGEEWARKWHVLDDSFRQMILSLGNLGKKIAPAFIALVDAKFPFSPDTAYEERG